MIGEECKFLHPAPCRKYMENLEKSCRAQCNGYHPELCKYSRATRECYNDRCFRMHLKRTRRKQTPPATKELRTIVRTTNQQQAIIATQYLAYNRPPPLLTLSTQKKKQKKTHTKKCLFKLKIFDITMSTYIS